MFARKDPTTTLDCPEGYIAVPGNDEFNTRDFCVAKYEMSHVGNLSPNTPQWNGTHTFNTVSYDSNIAITSQAGAYPIAWISQQESIDACI